MSASFAGNGPGSPPARTNRSRVGGVCPRDSIGVHRVAGDTSGSSATFRGPVRRSSIGAIVLRQVAAAIVRSAGVIVTCANFSASAKVFVVTSGPAGGSVPNVGGAPAVGVAGVCVCDWDLPLQAVAAPINPSGA